MRRRSPACAVLALALLVGGCAARQPGAANDPIEPFNRKIFWFNDTLDVYVLEPVAKGWDFIAPDAVQRALRNFFGNLEFPVVLVNDVLQGKPLDAVTDVGRFAVNTTAGVLGFFDPATGWGLEANNEDTGQTFGWWGIPPGPYLVLPFFGPSNPRDAIGRVGDSALRVYSYFAPIYVSLGVNAVDVINLRALYLQEVADAKEAAVDYYAFVRDAYTQRRARLVSDSAAMSKEEEEDLYGTTDDAPADEQ